MLIERGKIVKIGDPLDDWRAERVVEEMYLGWSAASRDGIAKHGGVASGYPSALIVGAATEQSPMAYAIIRRMRP